MHFIFPKFSDIQYTIKRTLCTAITNQANNISGNHVDTLDTSHKRNKRKKRKKKKKNKKKTKQNSSPKGVELTLQETETTEIDLDATQNHEFDTLNISDDIDDEEETFGLN